MTDLRADRMEGEQWVFEERTADPATTLEGERWLRTDLNTGDKIATLRVDVGSSIRDVPIFSTGTAVDTVSEAMRVQVNGVTGYVPIVPVSDAAFPELRMQHNSQVHGFHDRVEPGSAIPDSVVYQFSSKNAFTSSQDGTQVTDWPDETGSITASGTGGTVRESGINGNRSVEIDSTDDGFVVSEQNFPDITTEWTVIAVAETFFDSTLSENRALWHRASSGNDIFVEWAGANWKTRIDGTTDIIGSQNTGQKVITIAGDASGGVLREEGSQTASTTNSAADIQSLSIGFLEGVGRNFGGYEGIVEFHDQRLTGSTLQDREQELASRFGITI